MRTFLSGLLVLFLCAGCAMFEMKKASPLVVGSFNIRVNIDKTPHTWQEREPRCREVIAKNQFDIFGVQEALHYQLNGLVENSAYAYIGVGRNDFKNSGEHSAIIYKKERLELIDGGTFGLSEKPDVPGYMSWNTACPRIATWGLFRDRKTGKKFIFYNTHLDHISELARVNGIKLIVAHAGRNAQGTPMILTGDFNAKPGSETYKIAESLLDDSRVISETPHTGALHTYNGWSSEKQNEPIDFIFVSPDFRILSHKTDDSRFPEGFASDHYPVVMECFLLD